MVVYGKHFEILAFRKRFSNRRNLCFSVNEKRSENGAFRTRRHHDNNLISMPEFSSNANPKWPGTAAFSNPSGMGGLDRKHLMSFQRNPGSVFKAPTWCRRHTWCKTIEKKGQKNEENNKNNRFVRWCSIVTCPVSSTPRRSRFQIPPARGLYRVFCFLFQVVGHVTCVVCVPRV